MCSQPPANSGRKIGIIRLHLGNGNYTNKQMEEMKKKSSPKIM